MAPAAPTDSAQQSLRKLHLVRSPMAVVNDDTHRRTASIASLLGPSGDDRNLLSLSRLAAEMEPASPNDTIPPSASSAAAARASSRGGGGRGGGGGGDGSSGNTSAAANTSASAPQATSSFSRTRSVPHQRRSDSGLRLGVSGGANKRLSRTKSALGNMRRAVAAAASNMASATTTSSSGRSELSGGSGLPEGAHARALRPIQSNAPASSTNSLDSGATIPKAEAAAAMLTSLPHLHASRLHANRDVFQAAAARLAGGTSHVTAAGDQPSTPLTPRVASMEIDASSSMPQQHHHHHPATPRPSSSSATARARTTPDAKRAQNRESAKRFRVAQKKRWAELQDTVAAKDREIARLTDMLQKVTDARQPVVASSRVAARGSPVPLDALVMAELDLLVKLVSSPGASTTTSERRGEPLASPASNIGSLHRILVATTNGSITGVRHLNTNCGVAAGGAVGQYLWDDVHESDSLQLRFTVLHASRFADDMAREALVFAYRRGVTRRSTDGDSREPRMMRLGGSNSDVKEAAYIRMKGCVHPVLTDSGEVSHLMLAEFVET